MSFMHANDFICLMKVKQQINANMPVRDFFPIGLRSLGLVTSWLCITVLRNKLKTNDMSNDSCPILTLCVPQWL